MIKTFGATGFGPRLNGVTPLSLGKPAARFPGNVATDADLMIAVDRQQTKLTSPLDASATSMTVENAAAIVAYNLLTIESEIVKTTGAPTGNVVPISRGFDGTTPAIHLANTAVSGFVDAYHHNSLVAEVEAIENALGANLSKIPTSPVVASNGYDFTPQTPGGSLVVGANSIVLTPVPAGVNGSDTNHYLYISGGTGTAEAAKIIGGGAVAGAPTGTVIVQGANTHSGAWTIRSATAGIQEAINDLPATGGAVQLPKGTVTIFGAITIGNGTSAAESTRNGVHVIGFGPGATPSQGNPPSATQVTWAGPAGGIMFQFNGIVYNVGLEGMCLNCAGIAATGIQTNHATGCGTRFEHLTIVGSTGYGVVETAYTAGAFVYGAQAVWNDIHIDFGGAGVGGAASSGFNIGPASFTTLDVARSTYSNITVITGSSGTGIQINAADALSFSDIFILNANRSVHFVAAGGNPSFPFNIIFYRIALGVTPTFSAGWTGNRNVTFCDYLQENDGLGVPQPPFPAFSGFRGFTSFGAWYGDFGVNTVPSLATLEVFQNATHASIMAHNKTVGDSLFTLLNEGVGSYEMRNIRSSNTLTIASGAGDTLWTLPLAVGSPMVAVRPLRLTLATVPIFANNAAAITGGLASGQFYRTGADPDHLCIVH